MKSLEDLENDKADELIDYNLLIKKIEEQHRARRKEILEELSEQANQRRKTSKLDNIIEYITDRRELFILFGSMIVGYIIGLLM